MRRDPKPIATVHNSAIVKDGVLKPSDDIGSGFYLSDVDEIDLTNDDYYLTFTYATRAHEDIVVEVYDEKP